MTADAARSLVYHSVWTYRAAMVLLYGIDYWLRTERVAARLRGSCSDVVELCFGDARLASACRSAHIAWIGVDLNPAFCRHARAQGFPVIESDLWIADLPRADAYVMMASLYHFHDRLDALFDRVFSRTRRLVISEPVRNLALGNGLLARIAQRVSDPGTGAARFRFDRESLRSALANQAQRRRLEVIELSANRDLLVDLHA